MPSHATVSRRTLLMAGAGAALVGGIRPASAAMEFRLTHPADTAHPVHIEAEKMVARIAERTKGEVKVPREFRLAIPLFHGEAPSEIRCALRYRISPQGLVLGFEWRRVEYQRRAQFRELAYLIAEETGCPVFFGRTLK